MGSISHPAQGPDVLIVAGARWAYHCFHHYGAYICQAGRSFRSTTRLGYYAHGAIQREFPMIRGRTDHVAETRDTVHSLLMSGDPEDARLAAVVALLVLDGREGSHSQIFLLSPPQSEETLVLPHPIRNTRTGRGRAWTQGHRYVPETVIMSEPHTTDELDERVKATPRSGKTGEASDDPVATITRAHVPGNEAGRWPCPIPIIFGLGAGRRHVGRDATVTAGPSVIQPDARMHRTGCGASAC